MDSDLESERIEDSRLRVSETIVRLDTSMEAIVMMSGE